MKLVLPRISTLLATLLLLIARAHAQVDLARDQASRGEARSASSLDTIIPSPDDIHWDDRFATDSLNATAMAASGDELYLGGYFFSVGKVPANYIAVWNKRTKQWHPLGEGLDNIAMSLAIHDGDLYVGGWFSGGLRRWSIGEKKWYPLTPLPDSHTVVTAIAVDASDLYVATMGFDPPGSELRGRHLWRIPLAGGAWERLDGASAVDEGAVDHLVVMGSYLYVSGGFGSIDGVPGTAWIARMNIRTRVWSSLGGGAAILPDSADRSHQQGIFAMAGQGDGLYVGGRFTGAGDNLAWWDAVAESWHPLSVNGVVTALTVTADSLYVGGTFTLFGVGARSVHHLASISRDASHGIRNFDARATSVDYLAVTDADLYVVGNLWSVGERPVDVLGRADRSNWSWESLIVDHGLGVDGGRCSG